MVTYIFQPIKIYFQFIQASHGEMNMYCVTTRFYLKHCWDLLAMYIAYRRMQRDLKVASGLIRSAFLLEGPHTFYTLSIWESEDAIRDFANVPRHLAILRKSKHMCSAIWSAYWHLDAVSHYASSWPGVKPWPATLPQPSWLPPVSKKDQAVKGTAV